MYHSKPTYNSHLTQSEHWCETCDKGFSSLIALQKHSNQHQICNIDGCKYTAHPKVITKHVQMQHSTGLFSKISKLQTPEEINRWREERKKNFPTKSNIEKKKAALKEKIERGEKMCLNKKSLNSEHGCRRSRHSDRNRRTFKRKLHRPINKKPPQNESINTLAKEDESNLGLLPFMGISKIVFPENDSNCDQESDAKIFSDDEEWLDYTDRENCQLSKPVCSVLSNLIADYGLSEDDDNIDSKIQKSDNINGKNAITNNSSKLISQFQKDTGIRLDDTISTICAKKQTISESNGTATIEIRNQPILYAVNHSKDDDSGPEEMKIEKKPDILECEPVVASEAKKKQPKISKRVQNVHRTPHKRKLPLTLLEKLLVGEVRHERNITLQCIRYIVKNKFFDKESN